MRPSCMYHAVEGAARVVPCDDSASKNPSQTRGYNCEALSFASRDPMTVAPGGLAISLGRLTTPPIMWPRLRNVKRGTLFVLAARTDPSIMTLLLCKNRSFNFQRPMLDQTHLHTHLPYQTRFQACVFSNGASGRLSQQPIPDMAVSGQEVATGLGDLGRVCDTEVWTRRSRLI